MKQLLKYTDIFILISITAFCSMATGKSSFVLVFRPNNNKKVYFNQMKAAAYIVMLSLLFVVAA